MSDVIHFVDVPRIGTELRPLCGAWSDDVTWTTVPRVVTCAACASTLRISAGAQAAPPAAPAPRRSHLASPVRFRR